MSAGTHKKSPPSLIFHFLDVDYVYMQCHDVAVPFWNQIRNLHFPQYVAACFLLKQI